MVQLGARLVLPLVLFLLVVVGDAAAARRRGGGAGGKPPIVEEAARRKFNRQTREFLFTRLLRSSFCFLFASPVVTRSFFFFARGTLAHALVDARQDARVVGCLVLVKGEGWWVAFSGGAA